MRNSEFGGPSEIIYGHFTVSQYGKQAILEIANEILNGTDMPKDWRTYFLSLGQTLSTFHYTLLDKCRALLSVVERGWPNALDFSLDLELNIPPMYCLMNNSSMECFVHYLMNSNCACVRSTTLDNFALDQTSLDKLQSSRLHSTRWPNALDISLNMHVERCIVNSRERLARALFIRKVELWSAVIIEELRSWSMV